MMSEIQNFKILTPFVTSRTPKMTQNGPKITKKGQIDNIDRNNAFSHGLLPAKPPNCSIQYTILHSYIVACVVIYF